MKRILIGAAMLAATISISSCDKSEEVSRNIPPESALHIKTDIADTRSVISAYPDNSELGLFITGPSISMPYNNVAANSNVKSTLTKGTWKLSPVVYLSSINASIYAYYPYKVENTNPMRIPVEHESQTDYMFGTHTSGQAAINNGNPTVGLTMKHALALIQFKINKSNYTGVGKLTKLEIANATGRTALASEAVLSTETGALVSEIGKNGPAAVGNVMGLIANIPETASTDESTYPKLLVLPVASVPVAGDIVIKFTIDGKMYLWNVPAATVWAQGTKNTYTVTISGTAMVVGNVTIADWTTGTTGTAGLQ